MTRFIHRCNSIRYADLSLSLSLFLSCKVYVGSCGMRILTVSNKGDCIDDKTPLLRSCDAVNKQGLRLPAACRGFLYSIV